jgi:glycosyltransferase involved in cell wall biosynthesis
MSNSADYKVPYMVVVGPSNFPRGSATTSRVRAYGKGIIENGGSMTIVCLRPLGIQSLGESELPACGKVDGIDYIYTSGITVRPKSLVIQLFYEIKGLLNSFRVLWKLNRDRKITAILYYGTGGLYELPCTILAKCTNILVVKEKSEYPFLDRTKLLNKIKAYIHEHFEVKLYDGMLIISKSLESYYKPLMRKRARYLMVPILVDASRFENGGKAATNEKYIAYCGDPSGNKDGVPILLEAFSLIAKKHPAVKLYIIGDSHRKDVLPALQKKVEKLNIGDRVVFTGKVNPEEMPKYLCNAAVLALARPTSLQAKYGFPTKLGEYLATGKPVVVTDVGEIADFLRDGESAYIAPPDNAMAFAAKLDYVIDNYETAQEVGVQGKTVALKNFNYKNHGKRIAEFIQQNRS